MNKFLNGLAETNNLTYTENGALTHKTTKNALLDMFALGGAYRTRNDSDCVELFKKAFEEDALHALKCLFYLRDVRGGQGERRYFRVVMKWFANTYPDIARKNLKLVPEYGRWDDLYVFINTPLEADAFAFMKEQLVLDVSSKTPSLLAKWLKSENTSSADSVTLAKKTRKAFGLTPRQYRKTLSVLRQRINVLERLMSERKWDEIEFDKIPSRAGMIYKNAFARHDVERMKASVDNLVSYEDFAKDTTTKVNAKALYPYECVSEAIKAMNKGKPYWYYGSSKVNVPLDDTNRLMVNKYWDNLADYFKGASFNGMAIVDTSGSMVGFEASSPINVAISLGLYTAEKAKGPFANHFMTFSSNPTFVETEGVDFCHKVMKMREADWGGSTNIEAAFDLMLKTAIRHNCTQDEIPQNLIIISDMEFDSCAIGYNSGWSHLRKNDPETMTLMENIAAKWQAHGYEMPHLIFWNVQARKNNIPMLGTNRISYVSGFSPAIFEQIMTGKTGIDLCLEKLDSERYSKITV